MYRDGSRFKGLDIAVNSLNQLLIIMFQLLSFVRCIYGNYQGIQGAIDFFCISYSLNYLLKPASILMHYTEKFHQKSLFLG